MNAFLKRDNDWFIATKLEITNHRRHEVSKANATVTFDYKDYSDDNHLKQMKLNAPGFVRRFEKHISPK